MRRTRQSDEESRAAFRRRADGESIGYLKEIEGHLATLVADDERELLVNNALEGLDDLGNVCMDAVCTKILEGLAPHAGKDSLLKLLERVNQGDGLGEVATNPFGSHLLDALLQALSMKPMDGTEKVVKEMVEFIAAYMDDFLSDRYATYVLRRLLSVLCGREVGQIPNITRYAGKGDGARKSHETLPDIVFPELLKTLVDIVRGDDYQGHYLNGLIASQHSSPTLQAMVEACLPDRELLRGLVLSLVGQSHDGEIDHIGLRQKMTSRTSSHMMELIWQVADEDVRTALFAVLAEDLPMLSAHRIGNYSVQAMAKNATTSEQVGILVDKIGPCFTTLLVASHDKVIISVLTACLDCQSHMKNVCKLLSEALQGMDMPKGDGEKDGARAGIVEKLLCRETTVRLGKNISVNLSPFGCIMLSTILKYPPDCNNAFLGGILRLNSVAIQQLAKDKGGAHILETILQKPKYKAQAKKQILEKLDGTWGLIAKNPAGSRLVQTCFDIADASLKENIAAAIDKSEDQLSHSKTGSILLSHLRIPQFRNNRERWRNLGARPTRGRDNFLEEMEVGQDFIPVRRHSAEEAQRNDGAENGGHANGQAQREDSAGGSGARDDTGFHMDPVLFGNGGNAPGEEEGGANGDELSTLENVVSNNRKVKRRKKLKKEAKRMAAADKSAKRKQGGRKKRKKADAENGEGVGKGKKRKSREQKGGPDIVTRF